jgi:hypothetical protein
MTPAPVGQESKSKTLSTGTWLVIAALVGMLLASLVGLWVVVAHGNIPQISIHGWIAMGLGVVFSLVIGCGLMWLSFYSARQGFDDRADPRRVQSKPE